MVGSALQRFAFVILLAAIWAAPVHAQQVGSIRGSVTDALFEGLPLPDISVTLAETGEKVKTDAQGRYVFPELEAGSYTLLFSGSGFAAANKTNVVVTPGSITEVSIEMSAELVDMDEFFVQDIRIGGDVEAELDLLRKDSPSLVDSISSDLFSQAGAGDVAAALNLIPGATVSDNKPAVRGLPPRYVVSQLNGVRLPSADPETRAVDLDQFPSDVVRSVQVSKTFTPDQQGDASGGAVNVELKGIPDENIFKVDFGYSYNTNVRHRDDFLTYRGGGVNFFGFNNDQRSQPASGSFAGSTDALGTSRGQAPIDWSMGATLGLREDIGGGWTAGGIATFFYGRDSFYYDREVDDSYWVVGGSLVPQNSGGSGSRRTELFDVVRGSEEVKWGGLSAVGLQNEFNELTLLYLYTRATDDSARLAEDTRGKQFYFPGHDPDDPSTPGHADPEDAPYIRFETLKYVERTTESIQLNGRHTIPVGEFEIIPDKLVFLQPEIDWTLARNESVRDEPDRRQFGGHWRVAGGPIGSGWYAEKPAENALLGNVQRIFKKVEEKGDQYFANAKLPFEQWTEDEGYIKFGIFSDEVVRRFDNDSFSNFDQSGARFPTFTGFPDPGVDFDTSYSGAFPFWPGASPVVDGSAIPAEFDVDYIGEQDLSAHYVMADIPIDSSVKIIGGVRFEETTIVTKVQPEDQVTLVDVAGRLGTKNALVNIFSVPPGFADATFNQDVVLPAIGVVLTPNDQVTLRASYTETVSRQTFRELVPIVQQEFLGGDVFIGNPDLQAASLQNYDLRADYEPRPGTLISGSFFFKDIKDPIEYVQDVPNDRSFTFTTPQNFPEGRIIGWEFEIREDLGNQWERLEGLKFGANATIIDSEVTFSDFQLGQFASIGDQEGTTTRDMLNAPEFLYNINLTYYSEATGTNVGLFYTVKGDTLVVGPGISRPNFIPGVYQTETPTLNFSISQELNENFKLSFKAKNLLDPDIEEVYRSSLFEGDQVRTSYQKGIDFSLGISAEFTF